MNKNYTVTKPLSLYLKQLGELTDLASRFGRKHSPTARVAIDFLFEQPDEVIAAAFDRFDSGDTAEAQS